MYDEESPSPISIFVEVYTEEVRIGNQPETAHWLSLASVTVAPLFTGSGKFIKLIGIIDVP